MQNKEEEIEEFSNSNMFDREVGDSNDLNEVQEPNISKIEIELAECELSVSA